MYKIGEIFKIEDNYSERADFCNNNNLIIVEIEKDTNGKRQFQIQEPKPPTKQELSIYEIDNIKYWFNNYYQEHEQKYRRLHTLGLKCDNGSDPYNELVKLYNEAEQKRKRIQEIEELIK